MDDALLRGLECLRSSTDCSLAPAESLALALGLALGVGGAAWAVRRAVDLGITLRATAFTPRLSRVLSRLVHPVDHSFDSFLRADGAGPRRAELRRTAIEQLGAALQQRYARSTSWGKQIRGGISDLRFTDANRVPFPFARVVRERFELCSVVVASRGPRILDLDGNWTIDVSGSYGVNVAGYDRYKEWMRRGLQRMEEVGPVLGPLHPVVAENVATLQALSGLDEVSFHMSGTEAVMAAVRMARHNTRRKHVVCFAGAYHGWWDGVQPGLGSERALGDCITLRDMDPASLAAIRWRAREIAGVLVNPVQCFHPNAPPPSDAVLLTSDVRQVQQSTERYGEWLRQLRATCSEAGVPLIFDEVYSGFRLAPRGAQEYFGVHADLVVYGKTVAGGFPIGVVCGRSELMARFDPARPMRIAYVIGTFSAHPAVMGAMREFLDWVTEPAAATRYLEANRRCDAWTRSTNQQLADARLPVRLVNLGTVWTIQFQQPGRYSWLLQYYLRAEGVALSWVGTGRCLASLDFETKDYQELGLKILEATRKMKADGWWLDPADEPGSEKRMRMRLVREMAASLVGMPGIARTFYDEVMQRKADDHDASHRNWANQALHLLSSSVFLFCYVAVFKDVTMAMWLGLPALFLRQIGHAIFEPTVHAAGELHDAEAKLLGFNTPSKTAIVTAYLMIPLAHLLGAGSFGLEAFLQVAPQIAWHWLLFTLAVVAGRTAYLCWKHGLWSSMIWFVKLVSDPFSDLVAYSPIRLRRA